MTADALRSSFNRLEEFNVHVSHVLRDYRVANSYSFRLRIAFGRASRLGKLEAWLNGGDELRSHWLCCKRMQPTETWATVGMSGHAQERQRIFRRNEALENLLRDLNDRLATASIRADDPPKGRPIVLIMGPPRCGTTLALQWLARSGRFGYPSNLIARFWSAPEIGVLVQRMLFDPAMSFRDEFADLTPDLDQGGFVSDLGKTSGTLAPNEFWYFWRKFLSIDDQASVDVDAAARADCSSLRRGLRSMASAFDRPLAMKGMIATWHLPALMKAAPEAIVLRLKRDRHEVADSLLRARRHFFGDETQWYSFRPPEYERLRAFPPAVQVAGQILSMERTLDIGAALWPERWVSADYRTMTDRPEKVWDELRRRVAFADPQCDLGSAPAIVARTPQTKLSDERRAFLGAAFAEAEALLAATVSRRSQSDSQGR